MVVGLVWPHVGFGDSGDGRWCVCEGVSVRRRWDGFVVRGVRSVFDDMVLIF